MRFFRKIVIKITGNRFAQNALEEIIFRLQLLNGIGYGAITGTSGEFILARELKDKFETSRSPICIFDVGANKGQFLQLMLDGLDGIPSNFHAFEPSADAIRVLKELYQSKPNVKINAFGLGSKSGEHELFYDEPASGLASLVKRDLDHLGIKFEYSERVKIETLDEYCLEKAIDYIDLLKLDVEGFELDVLNGALQMFRMNKIGIVTFEFGGSNIDTRTYYKDFWKFFSNLDWDIFRITPSGHQIFIERYSERLEQFHTSIYKGIPKGDVIRS